MLTPAAARRARIAASSRHAAAETSLLAYATALTSLALLAVMAFEGTRELLRLTGHG